MKKEEMKKEETKKEFDWVCKKCKRDIPVSEGHIDGLCLQCAKETLK